jgi:putative endonuclease
MRRATRECREKRVKAKRWFLYLIECRDGAIYTGITVDVAARYAAHALGKGARYTRAHPPRRLLAVIDYRDRASASTAEYAVKQLSAAEKRAYALLLALGNATANAAWTSEANSSTPVSQLQR